MKKLFILAALTLFTASTWAYTLRVKNRSNKEAIGTVSYWGRGICSNDNFRATPGSEWSKSVGLCCTKRFDIQGADTPVDITTGTGCKDITVIIESTETGSLIGRQE